MTEAEWLACTDPTPMLEYLRGKASDRKLRLFAVACCRHIWEWLPDSRSRVAVEAAERFADGEASADELLLCRLAANRALSERSKNAPDDRYRFVLFAASDAAYSKAWSAADMMPIDAAWPTSEGVVSCVENRNVLNHQAVLLWEIFGNPFRPVTADPRWLTSTVVAHAQTIYEERAFDRLPILADALEDARCDDADILNHLRGDGPHVRGCWAVDLVLGKQ